jgi:hypothetical protein
MKKSDRINRILARGEVSGHSHIVTGECEVTRNGETIIIKAGKNCAIKHLLEQPFVEEGREEWTGEHTDIQLKEGEIYQKIQQIELNPYEQAIRNVTD